MREIELRVFGSKIETFRFTKLLLRERGSFPRVIEVAYDDKSVKIGISYSFHSSEQLEIDIENFIIMILILRENNNIEYLNEADRKVVKITGNSYSFQVIARNCVFENEIFESYEIIIIE